MSSKRTFDNLLKRFWGEEQPKKETASTEPTMDDFIRLKNKLAEDFQAYEKSREKWINGTRGEE